MKFLIIVLMFFIVSALIIISNNELSLAKKENIKEFYTLYIEWLDKTSLNLRTITGNVVKIDWLPNVK